MVAKIKRIRISADRSPPRWPGSTGPALFF
jgi:hypothetical protein